MSDPSAPVVVALLITDPDRTAAALEAIEAQTTHVRATYLVAGRGDGDERTNQVDRVLDVVEKADRDITHIWLLHSDATPRPDALAALLRESERTEASVAGSKLLNADDPDRLESVGGATDVVGYPYTGLQQDEIDQEQYDVVRDVAFAPGASMLVRRDLLRGLRGPDPLLEPGAAEIDFCQRARLSGGRVIVVPSSEVMHTASCRARVPTWRQSAGRYRAVAKAYNWLTLLWVLPLALVLGLVEAIVRTFAGRPFAVVDEVRAWVWNLLRLPSLIAERRALQRLVGDEELFRYQVGGSAGLRTLGSDLADRSRRRAESAGRPVGDWVARSATLWQTPGFAATLAMVVLGLVAIRTGLFGALPANGFALPLLIDPSDALLSVGGWWNPGGLGSPVPLHPSVVPQALAGFVLGPDTSRVVVLMLTAAVGAAGAWRLASVLELRPAARFTAALGLVAGPATAAAMADGYPAVLGAASFMPMVLATLIRPPRRTRWGRVGSVAGLSIGIGVATWFTPLAPVLVLSVVGAFVAVGLVDWRRVGGVVIATGLAAVWAGPYLLFVSIETLTLGSAPYWDVGLVIGSLLALAVIGGLLASDDQLARIAGAGGLLLSVGMVVARLTAAGMSREVWAVGMVAAAVGVMVVAGALVDGIGRPGSVASRVAKGVSALAIIGAIGIVAGPLVLSGTYGLSDVDWADRLAFSAARADAHGPDRTLAMGEDLPGEHWTVLGTPYRVLVRPGLEEAWIGPGQSGDRALDDALVSLYSESVVRPGERVAQFGIKWVLLEGTTPFQTTFESVLDMRQLPIPDATVFENLEPAPIASTRTGVAWSAGALGFQGPAADEIEVLVNSASGWDPLVADDGWAMTLAAQNGRVDYRAAPLMVIAGIVAVTLILLTMATWIATRKRP